MLKTARGPKVRRDPASTGLSNNNERLQLEAVHRQAALASQGKIQVSREGRPSAPAAALFRWLTAIRQPDFLYMSAPVLGLHNGIETPK